MAGCGQSFEEVEDRIYDLSEKLDQDRRDIKKVSGKLSRIENTIKEQRILNRLDNLEKHMFEIKDMLSKILENKSTV